jgi:hypothetical protein
LNAYTKIETAKQKIRASIQSFATLLNDFRRGESWDTTSGAIEIQAFEAGSNFAPNDSDDEDVLLDLA